MAETKPWLWETGFLMGEYNAPSMEPGPVAGGILKVRSQYE